MKILFVEPIMSGHHITYIKSLLSINDINKIVQLGKKTDEISENYIVGYCKPPKRSIISYRRFINEIYHVINAEKPDIVHFVYGDVLYRFLGIGLNKLHKKTKIIITFHQIRKSKLRNISFKRIAKKSDMIVVHTDSLTEDLQKLGIDNIKHIEYPRFNTIIQNEKKKAKERLKICDDNSKIFVCLGGTRYDKGLDILLAALKNIKKPFHLLIAGKEEYFDEAYISSETKDYSNKVTKILGFLDEDTFADCIDASDFIVLPYRKSFDGASGPLGEGVSRNKQIIGPSHGSLGCLINKYHLGRTFETENVISLQKCIEDALNDKWTIDEKYNEYKEIISPNRFKQSYYELYSSVLKD